MTSPILNAASTILEMLKEIEEILRRSGCLSADDSPALSRSKIGDFRSFSVGVGAVQRVASGRSRRARALLRSTPFLTRLVHNAKPWGEPDKTRMDEILSHLKYCNDFLYGILPQKIRDSVLEQGIAGYILEDGNSIRTASTISQVTQHEASLSQTMDLFILRHNTKRSVISNTLLEELRKKKYTNKHFESLPDLINSRWSTTEYIGESPGRRVLIEWYGYPRALDLALPDTINIAEDRFGRLACLLHASRKPSTLQTLNTTGFINNEIAGHFGLVFDIPTNVLITREPMSLYQLLHRRKDATREPLPSLDQRYRLAASLSTSLYTFMLSQWHHKRFLSQSIAFLYENKVPLPKLLDLEKPYIGGFSVSRPEDPQSESIESVLSIEERSYFHPLYRPWEPNRPKYRRAFDIYSFGLMLVEIGWWNLLKKIVPSSADGEDFRQLVIAKCQDDLACWMGERYLAVTLRCLNVDDTNMGGVGENLSDFYWQVVLELIKCTLNS